MVTSARRVLCKKCTLLFFNILFSFSMILYIQWVRSSTPEIICPIPKEQPFLNQQKEVVVLLWTLPFNEQFNLNQCEELFGITGCLFTSNRSLYNKADAVILHHSDIMYNRSKLPQQPRPGHQRWIWFNLEPPSKIINLDMMDNLINLSMTYRCDSDIFTPYGWTLLTEEPQKFSIPAKSKLVAWVANNWDPSIPSVRYYKELENHLPVDVIRTRQQRLNEDELIFLSKYKFYLAFEHFQNQDYVTEKLWNNALLSGSVPIVLGPTRANYERFLPAAAFIHVHDFHSTEELAEFLLALDKDDYRYQSYFSWRSRYKVVGSTSWPTHYCKACYFLQRPTTYRSLSSVAEWFR
ncbi:3-galactosyl-N-acetylglucosaminide 4-alpha-L-fucosyltransferase FUT3-like [Ambystoma mexicanum]|uniref:3-galactosyl-N-acetylglucosaminide 4-alpha-L-fucosyltransferase FUT3-like n=1 Tax=Ambystoma mexicanum TaxID=8296 RepID=UPI0037E9AFD2